MRALQGGSTLFLDHDQVTIGMVTRGDAMATNAAFTGELYAIDENHSENEAGCRGPAIKKEADI